MTSPLASRLRALLNALLSRGNLRLETLTAEKLRDKRLSRLDRTGHFDRPVYGELRQELLRDTAPIVGFLKSHHAALARLRDASSNDVGFTLDNDYYRTPDAEVLYTLVGMYRPRRIVEVGSGNSTKVMRQAIIDFDLDTRITSIDPEPRTEIDTLADEVHRCPAEELDADRIAGALARNDILFIDSSHFVDIGNDVFFLYFNVLPALAPGVIVHVHDIFLPYEYPKKWVIENQWHFAEQSILNAILQWSNDFDILWAGRHLQRTVPEFPSWFPRLEGKLAQSLWMQRRDNAREPQPEAAARRR